jgi:hypothetical protein
MTCRVAVRAPGKSASANSELDGREKQLADMKVLLAQGKQHVARSQNLLEDIRQRLHSQASM